MSGFSRREVHQKSLDAAAVAPEAPNRLRAQSCRPWNGTLLRYGRRINNLRAFVNRSIPPICLAGEESFKLFLRPNPWASYRTSQVDSLPNRSPGTAQTGTRNGPVVRSDSLLEQRRFETPVLFALPILREDSCRKLILNAAIPKKPHRGIFSNTIHRNGAPEISGFRTVSQEQKTQRGPTFRISSAPPTRHCERLPTGDDYAIAATRILQNAIRF